MHSGEFLRVSPLEFTGNKKMRPPTEAASDIGNARGLTALYGPTTKLPEEREPQAAFRYIEPRAAQWS